MFLVLANCEISPRTANANEIRERHANFTSFERNYIGGMEYHVYNSSNSSIFVVNYTKDALEVKLLKKQLGQ